MQTNSKTRQRKRIGRRLPAKAAAPLSILEPDSAGLDIGKEEILAAVPPDRDPEPVRSYATFTPDLEALADWLVACQIKSVVMESTGVYWIPIYELLERRGLRCLLVNARHIKYVPGRKADELDCQWLQKCHSFGLLRGSFRPDGEMIQLRTYLRHRAELIERRAPWILHIQKALHQMNLQLDSVLTDIMGATGQAILRAIVQGEHDPVKLAHHRQPSCHATTETIAKALTGQYRTDYLFALRQALECYDFYTHQIAACDAAVEQQFAAIKPRFQLNEAQATPAPTQKHKRNSHNRNEPATETRQHIYRIIGVDLVAIDGISNTIAQTLLAEIGTDVAAWPTVKHFASWLGLAPKTDTSAGKTLRSRTYSAANRAAQAFRMAALSVTRSDCVLGVFYRRLRMRLGPQQALVATAHKLARIYYFMLRDHKPYAPPDPATYTQALRQRALKALQRKAAKLGFTLQPTA
jgi:transposase